MSVLERLNKEKIDKAILMSTMIGRSVSAIKKLCSDSSIQAQCEKILNRFATVVKNAPTTTPSRTPSVSRTPSSSTSTKLEAVSIRSGCRNALSNALSTHIEDAVGLATSLEEVLYVRYFPGIPEEHADRKEHSASLSAYRSHSFMLSGGLKKNQEICEEYRSGTLTAASLATKTSQDFLTRQEKILIDQEYEKKKHDVAIAVSEGVKSTSFFCSKCKHNDTQYNQAQTRSADEPMTTFVLCNVCGNRWKFSE